MNGSFRIVALVSCSLWLVACGASNDVTIAPTASSAPRVVVNAPPPLETGRLPLLAKPTHYALDLTVDPKDDHLTGTVTIALDVLSPTDVLVLHGRELTYKRAVVVEKGETLSATVTPRASVKNIGTPDELVVTLPRKISGSVELSIDYTALFTDQLAGAYKTVVAGEPYVFTQFEPMDARRAFPSFDEPGFKVPFDVSITTPKGNLAVANTSEVARAETSDKRSLKFKFATTRPLPTYLVAFAVGPLEVVEAKGSKVPLRVVTVKGKTALGGTALEATKAFIDISERYFATPYPYDKLDLVAVPDFAAGAMENAGLITFREELILADKDRVPASALRNIGIVIAHELSHHWFGDLVTMSWWDDLWLNEGFASWMETKVVDAWKPELGAGVSSVGQRTEAMSLDARPSARAVRREVRSASDADEAFDAIIYDKGAAVLGMLEAWLGPEAFQKGVQQYLRTHAYGSATAGDLFEALGEASKKDVVSVAASFFDKPGVPLVSVELDCPKGKDATAKVRLHEERLVIEAKPGTSKLDGHWKVPVCIDYEGHKGAPVCTLLDGDTGEIDLGKGAACPKWIAPNVDERGYYRYALSADLFRALAKANVSARTRFGVLDNAAALVQSGKLGADVLFDLIELEKPPAHLAKLTAEDGLLVSKLVSTLDGIGLWVDDADRPRFAKLVASDLMPLVKDLGLDPKKGEPDDARLLRRDLLLGLAPLVDDPWLKAESEKRVAAMLKDPGSVDGDTITPAAIVAARTADAARFDAYVGLLKKVTSPQLRAGLVNAVGSFGDPALARRALDLMLDPEMKKQDGFYLLRWAAKVPSTRPVVLAWLGDHLSDIKTKLPSFMRAAIVDELSICDTASVEKAHALFDGKLNDVEGGERALAQLFERADLCIAQKAREHDRIDKRLGAR